MQNLKVYALFDKRTNTVVRGPKRLWYDTETSVKQSLAYERRMTIEDISYLVAVEFDLSNSFVREI